MRDVIIKEGLTREYYEKAREFENLIGCYLTTDTLERVAKFFKFAIENESSDDEDFIMSPKDFSIWISQIERSSQLRMLDMFLESWGIMSELEDLEVPECNRRRTDKAPRSRTDRPPTRQVPRGPRNYDPTNEELRK